jgi:hypothetical protein
VPLFEQYGVDIVFNGHDHGYERSLYNDIYYIVAAGGGGSLGSQSRSSPYSQLYLRTYNYVIVTKSGGNLVIRTYDDDSNLIDQFQIAP